MNFTVIPKLGVILKERNITQMQLSEMSGVAQSAISRFDKNKQHQDAHLIAISRALGITIEDLFIVLDGSDLDIGMDIQIDSLHLKEKSPEYIHQISRNGREESAIQTEFDDSENFIILKSIRNKVAHNIKLTNEEEEFLDIRYGVDTNSNAPRSLEITRISNKLKLLTEMNQLELHGK